MNHYARDSPVPQGADNQQTKNEGHAKPANQPTIRQGADNQPTIRKDRDKLQTIMQGIDN